MVEKEVADYALDQLGLRLPPNDEARQQANTEQGIADRKSTRLNSSHRL